MIWKVLWHSLCCFQQWGLRRSHGRTHKVNDYQEMSPCHLARVPDLWWYYDPLNHMKNILLLSQFTGTSLLLQGSCPGNRCFIRLQVHFEWKHSGFGWLKKALTIFSPLCSSWGFSCSVFGCCVTCENKFSTSYWFITGVLLASGLAALASASRD